ncbi:MAG: DUF3244 domain-containing protein [Bacteroides sp.]|nr:DUF3244 domain-containing protein [Bacteroides sp.]
MRILTIVAALLIVSLTSTAADTRNVDLAGKLTPVVAFSNVEPVIATWDGEYINIYFNISLEQISVEIVNLYNGDKVYSATVNSFSDKNLSIDLSHQIVGEYKIVFINTDSGDFMYGRFNVEK